MTRKIPTIPTRTRNNHSAAPTGGGSTRRCEALRHSALPLRIAARTFQVRKRAHGRSWVPRGLSSFSRAGQGSLADRGIVSPAIRMGRQVKERRICLRKRMSQKARLPRLRRSQPQSRRSLRRYALAGLRVQQRCGRHRTCLLQIVKPCLMIGRLSGSCLRVIVKAARLPRHGAQRKAGQIGRRLRFQRIQAQRNRGPQGCGWPPPATVGSR